MSLAINGLSTAVCARVSALLSLMKVRGRFFEGSGMLLALTAALGAGAVAGAQVTYTGTAANQNFGSVAIGSTSAAQSFSFSVAAGTTVGSIGVLTTGVPNLDFANATGTTCTATTYASAASCTVSVTLNPKYAGQRRGAVVFFSGAGNEGTVLGSVLIYGTGTGPQAVLGPGTATVINPTVEGESLLSSFGAATDAAGNLFVSDGSEKLVWEIPADGGAAIQVAPGFSFIEPYSLAFDGAGDVFVADNSRIVEIPVGGGTPLIIAPTINGYPFLGAHSVAVDALGDLFVADENQQYRFQTRVTELPAGGGAPIAIFDGSSPNFDSVYQLAVSPAGDLYAAIDEEILKFPAGGGAPVVAYTLPSGHTLPEGVAIDAAGDLFVADYFYAQITEIFAGGATAQITPEITVPNGFYPSNLAIDGAGNIFTANVRNAVRFGRAQTQAINFPTPSTVGTADTKDGAAVLRLENIGTSALTLDAPETGKNPDFPTSFAPTSARAETCPEVSAGSAGNTLAAGSSCQLSIGFYPEEVGPLSESLTITDNSLNAPGPEFATQTIQLTATGLPNYALLSSPAQGSKLTGTTTTFTWTPPKGGTIYGLSLGTTGVGSSNLYDSGHVTGTSVTVNNLPTDNATIYARLWSYVPGSAQPWITKDYTFTAATQGTAIQFPIPGSVLTSSTATFSWTSVDGTSIHALNLGSTGVGSANLYNSGQVTGNSVTATGLPTNGEVIYAALWTYIANSGSPWIVNDYIYRAK
jgi:hypothetical protein